MSKSSKVNESVGYSDAIVTFHHTPETLVGRVLGIIEAIGLPEKQESSVKNLIKDSIYSTIYDMSVGIQGDLNTVIQNAYKQIKEDAHHNQVPPRTVCLEDII